MVSKKSKRSSRGRTTEAKLLITTASIAATLSGLAMFATQNAETQAQNQSAVVVSIPAARETDEDVPTTLEDAEADDDVPSVQPTPAPVTGRTRGARGLRSQQGQQGQQSLPNSMGTTRSSR